MNIKSTGLHEVTEQFAMDEHGAYLAVELDERR
jgi:hypothetical protein